MPPTDPTDPQPTDPSTESVDAHEDLTDYFVEHANSDAVAAPDHPGEIGRRLADARVAAGLSPRDLADHLGVKESTITKWESGERSPRGQRVSKLAGILGVSLSWILVGRGVEPTGHNHDAVQLRAELRLARDRLDDVVSELAVIDKRLAEMEQR
jgi:transcriptional regulator with XRE-family HTH domain